MALGLLVVQHIIGKAAPCGIVLVAGEMVTVPLLGAVTVKLAVPTVPLIVQLMVAVPAATAVMTLGLPEPATVAMLVLLLAHGAQLAVTSAVLKSE